MFRSDSAFRTLCSAALCGMLLCQPLLAEGPVSKKTKNAGSIAAQDRARYALNRFTFGPRPGELEAVEKTGLDRWFDQQLHPEKLDDTAMRMRLDQYPAMKLSTAELMRRFPSPQMIRVMDRTGASLPSDPIERAIYRHDVRWGLGLRTATYVYTFFAFFTNALHARFDPRSTAGMAAFALLFAAARAWIAGWTVTARAALWWRSALHGER